MNYYLGIDNGLTSVKAVLFDETGDRVSICEEKNHIQGVIIDAEALWESTARCIKKAINGFDTSEIKCIANSGHGNGLYAVKNGKSIYAASSMILGTDKYINKADVDKIFDTTLQKVWPGQPGIIMNWLKHKHRDVYDSAEYFMFCKDYIKYRLTGSATTDYSDASAGGLIDIHTDSYSKTVLDEFDIIEILDKLPKLLKSTDVAGTVNKEAAEITGLKEGTYVASGVFDVNSCMIGSGAFNNYCVISGTWGINAGLSDTPLKSDRIRQCCIFADRKKYMCIDSAPTSATNLEWFTNNIIKENDYGKINKMMKRANDTDIIYLPFLYEPNIKGGFIGLSYETTDADMIKALLEGVCFEHRRQIDNLRKSGIEHSSVILSGGAANSDFWMQLFANILQMPITTVLEKQAGALGAAVCASICAGQYADIYSAAEAMVKIDKTFVPHKNYDEKYERYLRVIELAREI